MAKVMAKLPGVTSFTRRSVISDGAFYSLVDGVEVPLPVVRHGIRGTQNINNTKEREPSQIQVTETARTEVNADAFLVRFNLRFLPLQEGLHACAVNKQTDKALTEALRAQYEAFVSAARNSDGLAEVSLRTARNILNGRWLWRNRSLGEAIEISASTQDKRINIDGFDALELPLNAFGDYTREEQQLGDYIQHMLQGEATGGMTIEARVSLGFTGSVEVFPSQNYVSKKPKGFARPLYKLGVADKSRTFTTADDMLDYSDIRRIGQAALRDQKIGNALRTIDTWYPDAQAHGYRPIPVEPEGANLDSMSMLRKHKGANSPSAFALATRMAELDPNSADGMFLIAALMRGGVYGEAGE
jgi:CRISPR-associated protein Csy3